MEMKCAVANSELEGTRDSGYNNYIQHRTAPFLVQ